MTTLLTVREVSGRVGLSRMSLHRMLKAGWFPEPVRVGRSGTAIRWRDADIEAWIAGLGKEAAA